MHGDDVNDAQTPAGEFARNILLAQNQYHARRVASDVMATECNNAKNGLTSGGVPPYGYKIVNKRYELNPNEADAVKLIFDGIIKGFSYNEIIKQLNDRGFKPRRSVKFTLSTINAILHNEKYCGTLIYNKKGGKRKKHRVLIEHFDEVRNEGAIPQLISRKDFEKVQKQLSHNQNICRPKQDSAPEFVLTGLVFCKSCGKSMSGFSTIGGRAQTRQRYYGCPNHSNRNGNICATKAINANYLEKAVKQSLVVRINSFIRTNGIEASALENVIADLAKHKSQLSRYKSELDGKINGLLDKSLSASETIAAKYTALAEEYTKTSEQKDEEIQQLINRMEAMRNVASQLSDGTKQFAENELFASAQTTRQLIRLLVEHIEVDDINEDITIIFK